MYMFTIWGGQAEGRTNKHTKQSDYRGLPLPPEPSPLIIQLTLHSTGTYQVVVVVSHIQRIGCQPEKNYFTRWPIPLVVC